MGTIFTLDAGTKSVIAAVFDDLITELGKDCRLVYPARYTDCVNCVAAPIGQLPSNVWRHGGPVQFPLGGICPVCQGSGQRAEEATEIVRMLCAWTPKDFFVPVPTLPARLPYSLLQTKFFLTDLPKLLRADHVVFQVDIEGICNRKFRLVGEPGDASSIIQARYAVCGWERIGV